MSSKKAKSQDKQIIERERARQQNRQRNRHTDNHTGLHYNATI